MRPYNDSPSLNKSYYINGSSHSTGIKILLRKIQFIVSWILNKNIKYKNYLQNSSGGDFAVTQKLTF